MNAVQIYSRIAAIKEPEMPTMSAQMDWIN